MKTLSPSGVESHIVFRIQQITRRDKDKRTSYDSLQNQQDNH